MKVRDVIKLLEQDGWFLDLVVVIGSINTLGSRGWLLYRASQEMIWRQEL